MNLPGSAGVRTVFLQTEKCPQTYQGLQVCDTRSTLSEKCPQTCQGLQVCDSKPKNVHRPARVSRFVDTRSGLRHPRLSYKPKSVHKPARVSRFVTLGLPYPKTDHTPARVCRFVNSPYTSRGQQVYPWKYLWINLPGSAGLWTLYTPAVRPQVY